MTTQEPNEEKTVNQREVQPDPTTGTDCNNATEDQKTVSQDQDGQWPELVYPAKLTEQEQADIATQVDPLPPEIAQQMLDVVESRMQSGQIRTNPAALLRGVIRKYQADPDAFDPSSGFHIADQRRRRAEAEARLRAAEARRPYETATGIPHRRSEEQRRNARKFVEESLRTLRGG
jgi:hypothetical protein